MAVSKTDRATGLSTAVQSTVDLVLSSLTVGGVLIIRAAVDNTGGGGAARTVTVTNQSGTAIDTGASMDQRQQNNDPGASGAGITINTVVANITATSGTVRLTYSGTAASNAIAEEWFDLKASPVVGTPVGATSTNTNLPVLTDSSVASGNVVYAAVAIEAVAGDTITADSDTTNGSWVELTKAAAAATAEWCYGAYKIVTATGSQTHNGTISTGRDSAGLILELAAVVTVSATLAAPLGGVTASTAATVQQEASLAAPLGGADATGSATVEHIIQATLDGPLGGLAASTSASVEHPATFDAPLGAVTASATAVVEHAAIGTAALGVLTATAAATPEHPATLDATLGATVATATATPDHPAALDAPTGPVTATATATVEHEAVLQAPLGGVDAQATATVEGGSQTVEAILTAPLGALTASFTATPIHPAILQAPIGALIATMIVLPPVTDLRIMVAGREPATTYTGTRGTNLATTRRPRNRVTGREPGSHT